MTEGTTHFQGLDFIAEVVQREPDGQCVPWPGRFNPDGYARLYVAGEGTVTASHLVLEASGRPRPPAPGNHALHSCDTPLCVAPWHLRWGTHQENMDDRMARRGPARIVGEKNGRAVLSRADVEVIRSEVAGGTSRRAVARRFGLHHSTVGQIVRRELWR